MDNTTRTIKEWAVISGINPDTARRTAARKSGQSIGLLSVLTADEWEMWRPGKSREKSGKHPVKIREKSAKNPVQKSVFEDSPAAVNESPSGKTDMSLPTLSQVRAFLLDALLICIVVGHAGLIWYDCSDLWDVPGQIGGGLAFCIILAAVMLATDPAKNITSQYGLFLALLVDVGAFWVHRPVFESYRVSDEITGVLCGFLCGMSFGALFLYRHLKNN